eukprot:3825502-Karenia_brevis.AAC.1
MNRFSISGPALHAARGIQGAYYIMIPEEKHKRLTSYLTWPATMTSLTFKRCVELKTLLKLSCETYQPPSKSSIPVVPIHIEE